MYYIDIIKQLGKVGQFGNSPDTSSLQYFLPLQLSVGNEKGISSKPQMKFWPLISLSTHRSPFSGRSSGSQSRSIAANGESEILEGDALTSARSILGYGQINRCGLSSKPATGPNSDLKSRSIFGRRDATLWLTGPLIQGAAKCNHKGQVLLDTFVIQILV